MKKVPYSGRTILEGPVHPSFIWRFLLCSCELIHIFVYKGDTQNNYAEKIRRHLTKFSLPGSVYLWSLFKVLSPAFASGRQVLRKTSQSQSGRFSGREMNP